jgi:hypothetical protein
MEDGHLFMVSCIPRLDMSVHCGLIGCCAMAIVREGTDPPEGSREVFLTAQQSYHEANIQMS